MNANAQIRRDIIKDWQVLLVDDEPDNLEVALRVLRFYGAQVRTAENGKEALDLLQSKQLTPRFILSDISMPVMDGWAFLYELKRDPLLVNIPVIALTAHAMAGDRERGLQAGFHNYLTKPFNPGTMMRELLQMLVTVPALAAQLA